ncbi:hypothetical protein ACHMW6_19665 [Pseudoduganella sp. UC29_106]|uniref:hypothetical protein n=1 Tax=Pseudoduganella sp. UC29_106 TaxID=3374553 RepID=UPI0037584599
MGAIDRLRRSTAPELEELELELLLEGMVRRYGHDFRMHERSQLKRRLYALMQQRGLRTLSQLLDRVLHDPATCSALLRSLSVPTATLFDDPAEAVLLREAAQASLLRHRPAARVAGRLRRRRPGVDAGHHPA